MRSAVIVFFAVSALIAAACSSGDNCSSDPCAACQTPCTQSDSCSNGAWTCDCSCDESGEGTVFNGDTQTDAGTAAD